MGISFSFMGRKGGAAARLPRGPGLGDLPESCVASVLVYLDAPQICKLAMLNRALRGASSADFVWKSKLPLNYEALIAKISEKDDSLRRNLCKRDIYAMLCRPNSFGGGAKVVWLDKNCGKTCLSIPSNELIITGMDDRRCWSRIPSEESRFASVLYLQQIWWFQVDGEVDFPFPTGSYSLFFRLQLGRTYKRLGRRACSSEHIHGWDKKPVKFQFSTSDGQQGSRQCHLKEPGKWIHYHVGDFRATASCESTKIRFSMTQIDCTHPKGGLCVDSVLIYPVEYKERQHPF